jgi:hypothetical protein
VPWPLDYPTPHNITPDNQDYGFFMEIHSVLATRLGWKDLQGFTGAVLGKQSKTVDWSTTYREALALVHHALGIRDGKEGPIPDRLATLAKWSIDREQILTQENVMAKKKSAVVKNASAAAVDAEPTNSGRTSAKEKNESNVPKSSLAPAKGKKVAAEKAVLSEDTIGGLKVCAWLLSSLSQYTAEAVKEAPGDARLAEIAEHVREAAKALDKLTD